MKIEYAGLNVLQSSSDRGQIADSPVLANAGFDPDEVFHQSWKHTIERCKIGLENDEFSEASQVKSHSDFSKRLENIQPEKKSQQQMDVLCLLPLTLAHYQTFATIFVNMMKRDIDISLMWGLLYLVIQCSLRSSDSLSRVNRLLRAIGTNLNSLSEICESTAAEKIIEDSVQVQNEMMVLWVNIISLFRHSKTERIEEREWKPIQQSSDTIVQNIKDTVEKFLKISQILLTNKQFQELDIQWSHAKSQRAKGDSNFQVLNTLPNGKSTCHKLPAAPNFNFFGRESHLAGLKSSLHIDEDPVAMGLFSVTLHGLAGMGKTQIALRFAHQHTSTFHVIIWLNCETEESMKQSFNSAAVDWLGLPGAKRDEDAENRLALLNWLQETEIPWLFVYDNAEDSAVLNKYWPISAKRGSCIITSRKHIFNWGRDSLEVTEFTPETGLGFIAHLLRDRTFTQSDREAASELTQMLHGHPLGINQMVALMHNKLWSFSRFLKTYRRNRQTIFKSIKAEWSHGGYGLVLGNLFSMLFSSLPPMAHQILGIMSLISPDIITQDIFSVSADVKIPQALEFCRNEDELDDVIEKMIELALIKCNTTDDTINIHRLVQDEYKMQLSQVQFQEAFDSASLLLYEAFPKQEKGELFGERMSICARFILHVHSLRDNSNEKGLVPSAQYVKLMTNAAWYCAERQGHHDLELILENSFRAMTLNGMKDTEPLLWAHLCNSAGRLWTQRGNFELGEKYLKECLCIRERELGPGDENIAGVLSNLGNVNSSMARYEVALDYQIRALNWGIVDGSNKISLRAQTIITMNTGRVLAELGRIREAEEWFKRAEGLDSSSNNSPYALFYKARVSLKSGNLEMAKRLVQKSHDAQVMSNEGPISLLLACCKYRLASISLAQGDSQTAIQHLQDARMIIGRQQAPVCHEARVLHLLWKTKSYIGDLNSKEKKECEEMLERARSIRKDLVGNDGGTDCSEEAYDLLIDCQLR